MQFSFSVLKHLQQSQVPVMKNKQCKLKFSALTSKHTVSYKKRVERCVF